MKLIATSFDSAQHSRFLYLIVICWYMLIVLQTNRLQPVTVSCRQVKQQVRSKILQWCCLSYSLSLRLTYVNLRPLSRTLVMSYICSPPITSIFFYHFPLLFSFLPSPMSIYFFHPHLLLSLYFSLFIRILSNMSFSLVPVSLRVFPPLHQIWVVKYTILFFPLFFTCPSLPVQISICTSLYPYPSYPPDIGCLRRTSLSLNSHFHLFETVYINTISSFVLISVKWENAGFAYLSLWGGNFLLVLFH